MSGYNVAIVGATGAVGARMIKMVEQTSLPVNSVKLLASSRSAGKQLQFNGQALTVEETVPESFEGIDLASSQRVAQYLRSSPLKQSNGVP